MKVTGEVLRDQAPGSITINTHTPTAKAMALSASLMALHQTGKTVSTPHSGEGPDLRFARLSVGTRRSRALRGALLLTFLRSLRKASHDVEVRGDVDPWVNRDTAVLSASLARAGAVSHMMDETERILRR